VFASSSQTATRQANITYSVTLRCDGVTIAAVETQILHIPSVCVCVCVCSLSYPARKTYVPYRHLCPV